VTVTAPQPAFAVGSLVSARGREWVVLPDSEPDLLVLRPLGATDAEIAGILPELEEVRPATFDLPDPHNPGDARSAALLRDALRLGFRSSAGPFRSFGQISVEPRPYQLVPLMMALRLDPVRLLIADDVGIGKTIEAALIARELLDQGSADRLAVLCPPHLAEQWQVELREKFHIDAQLVLSSTARRLERSLGVGESLFEVYDHVIVSTDFIKAPQHRDDFVRTCPELVIVDEAHGFAFGSDRGRQLRHELLARLTANEHRHVILATATPHSGNDDAFRSLLTLLDPVFSELPDDLSGPANEPYRRRLARHLVQRRRGDITDYLHIQTPFPEREQADSTYTLTPDYRRLFDRAVAYARETWEQTAGDKRRQRVHWWSALGLLRSLGSSPDAAVATLHNRAHNLDVRSAEEADELGRRDVLDQAGDEDAESLDLTPGARLDSDGGEQPIRSDSWFAELARAAAALAGDGDPKLQAALKLITDLVKQGHNPIVFCRFIPTADYVARHLRERLGARAEVAAVTGMLAPTEREERVAELSARERRVLVATDCLSEGINLQDHFDAVVHYDLSWNPTRHEQREGRVDRYGQPRPIVRVITFYGANSPIDGIVLDVLLRKHQRIRKALGVAVPVPTDSAAVIDAILEGLITRGRPGEAAFEQLSLDVGQVAGPFDRQLELEWQTAAEREKRTQTMYAQHAIKPDEVCRELLATREATGAGVEVRRFVTQALRAYGASVHEGSRGGLVAGLEEAPAGLREAVGLAASDYTLEIARDGSLSLERTHPVVQALAAHVLDSALDPYARHVVAARCGVVRTSAVQRRTSLLLLRMRFHLIIGQAEDERQLLAEDAALVAFTGTAEAAEWLGDEQTEALLAAYPDANVSHEQAARYAERLVEALPSLGPALDEFGRRRARELLATHRRVRQGARAGGSVDVEAQLPVDVLGAYVLLPTGDA
jgi:superfamily II DNA or RNA helicase